MNHPDNILRKIHGGRHDRVFSPVLICAPDPLLIDQELHLIHQMLLHIRPEDPVGISRMVSDLIPHELSVAEEIRCISQHRIPDRRVDQRGLVGDKAFFLGKRPDIIPVSGNVPVLHTGDLRENDRYIDQLIRRAEVLTVGDLLLPEDRDLLIHRLKNDGVFFLILLVPVDPAALIEHGIEFSLRMVGRRPDLYPCGILRKSRNAERHVILLLVEQRILKDTRAAQIRHEDQDICR